MNRKTVKTKTNTGSTIKKRKTLKMQVTSSYVVAIPTYNRPNEVVSKTLTTLQNGHVSANKIYIFVANKEEYERYNAIVPKTMYHKIIVGEKGIVEQRMFIRSYFKNGQCIVSLDDDVECFKKLEGTTKLKVISNIDTFFIDAFAKLKKEHLFLWGIYPVANSLFMKHGQPSTDLKFILGSAYGFINRHIHNLDIHIAQKEDIEQSILYYKYDGGVLRYNNICIKTKFMADGGLGVQSERIKANRDASNALQKEFPDCIASIFQRKNGIDQVRLSRKPRFFP